MLWAHNRAEPRAQAVLNKMAEPGAILATVVAVILYASVLGTSHLLARVHAIFTHKMAAELILIAHFTHVILVYSTIIRLL